MQGALILLDFVQHILMRELNHALNLRQERTNSLRVLPLGHVSGDCMWCIGYTVRFRQKKMD